MKAMLLTGFGGTDMLRYGDAPDPVAGPGDVVVDVHAASVNAADYKMRLGSYSDLKFPHILGRDFSGVVSAVGAGVDDLKVGDAVFGVTIPGTEGAYAEKIAIKAAIVAKKPQKLSHVEAAAMALTSLTAIWALEDTADVLKPDGRLVWIAAAPTGFQPSRSDVKVLRPRVDRDRAHLERMGELLSAGAVWPPAITRYKLADAAEAHRVSEGRHLQGKLVLEVR
jgi:NADPH:quinone reductase-like Zn-dependent oxidoreductase